METIAAITVAFLAGSTIAPVVVIFPTRLAWTVAILVGLVALLLWHEWVKREKPTDDWQQYGPLFAFTLGAVLGGFLG